MDNELNTKINPRVKTRVSVKDTILSIQPGETVTFKCTELAAYPTVSSFLSRLNTRAGRKEYSVATADYGASYTITRSV